MHAYIHTWAYIHTRALGKRSPAPFELHMLLLLFRVHLEPVDLLFGWQYGSISVEACFNKFDGLAV